MELYDGEQFYYELNGQIEGHMMFHIFDKMDHITYHINGRRHKFHTCFSMDCQQIFHRINNETYIHIEYSENNSCITFIENMKIVYIMHIYNDTIDGIKIKDKNVNIFDYIPEEYKYLLEKYKWIIDLNKDTIDKITEELKN